MLVEFRVVAVGFESGDKYLESGFELPSGSADISLGAINAHVVGIIILRYFEILVASRVSYSFSGHFLSCFGSVCHSYIGFLNPLVR
jgi:hypothetical protein